MNSTQRAVVVGIDISGSSDPALDWAAAEAARLGRPLRIVHAYPPPTYPSTGAGLLPGGTVVSLGEQLQKAAVASVTACADRVRMGYPDLEIRAFTRCGSAGTTLVETSRTAELVVVGARGLGAVKGMLFGSVSVHVSAHSFAPVVVVQETSHAAADARVVVGVDGSETSQAALAFAVEQASSRGVGLTVVHTWRVDANEGDSSPLGWSAGWGHLPEEEEALMAEAVAGLGEQYPDVDIRREVVTGNPADALERLSQDACLLVVGTRGRGTFAGWLKGSVSQAVLHAATCPVVVVHPPRSENDRTDDERQPVEGSEPAVEPTPVHEPV